MLSFSKHVLTLSVLTRRTYCSLRQTGCKRQDQCNFTALCASQDLVPPKDPEIQVRALQDYGEMVASNGTIHFQKNAVFFMAQEDAEPLIRNKVLERMDMSDLH